MARRFDPRGVAAAALLWAACALPAAAGVDQAQLHKALTLGQSKGAGSIDVYVDGSLAGSIGSRATSYDLKSSTKSFGGAAALPRPRRRQGDARLEGGGLRPELRPAEHGAGARRHRRGAGDPHRRLRQGGRVHPDPVQARQRVRVQRRRRELARGRADLRLPPGPGRAVPEPDRLQARHLGPLAEQRVPADDPGRRAAARVRLGHLGERRRDGQGRAAAAPGRQLEGLAAGLVGLRPLARGAGARAGGPARQDLVHAGREQALRAAVVGQRRRGDVGRAAGRVLELGPGRQLHPGGAEQGAGGQPRRARLAAGLDGGLPGAGAVLPGGGRRGRSSPSRHAAVDAGQRGPASRTGAQARGPAPEVRAPAPRLQRPERPPRPPPPGQQQHPRAPAPASARRGSPG